MEEQLDDNNKQKRERKLKKLAEKIKKETNLDVIISAENIKNLLTIRLKTEDEFINYYIICNEDDIFNKILNKIFELKPELKDFNLKYVCNISKINRYESIKNNKIKNNDIIMMYSEDKKNFNFLIYDETYLEKEKLKEIANKLKEKNNLDVLIATKTTKNLISINFKSMDQKISFLVLCNQNDIFNSVANKVFEQNPEFKEKGNNYFLCKGNRINENKSLFENDIDDGDAIILVESFDD